jgi:hypothetical protein
MLAILVPVIALMVASEQELQAKQEDPGGDTCHPCCRKTIQGYCGAVLAVRVTSPSGCQSDNTSKVLQHGECDRTGLSFA